MNQGNITDDGSQPHRYDVLFKSRLPPLQKYEGSSYLPANNIIACICL